jgi:hypothetical protein
MAAMRFIPVNPAAHVEQATGFDLQLLTVIFMTCLILGVAFCVAMLERRLRSAAGS